MTAAVLQLWDMPSWLMGSSCSSAHTTFANTELPSRWAELESTLSRLVLDDLVSWR